MKNEVSNRDLELLSAYLDQELNPKESAYVEKRLQSDPILRNILGELHQNRAALRSLPRLRAPRNFTLSPELVGIKPKKRSYPVFGLVSALSSLVLIIVLLGDFLVNPAMTSLPVVEQEAQLSAVTESAQDAELFVEKAIEATPYMAPEEPAMAEQALPVTETPDIALRSQGAGGEATEETPVGIESLSSIKPEATSTPTPSGFTSTATPGTILPTGTPTIPPTIAITEITIEDRIESVVPSTPPVEPPPSLPGIPPVRFLEIALAALTLVSGLAALYLRSKSK